MPVLVVTMPENFSPKERIRVRFEKSRRLFCKPSLSALEKIATEWHQMKSAKWSVGYASDIMEAFQNDIFPLSGLDPLVKSNR
jgi:hypothetical protein